MGIVFAILLNTYDQNLDSQGNATCVSLNLAAHSQKNK